jgi:hypothetical protein
MEAAVVAAVCCGWWHRCHQCHRWRPAYSTRAERKRPDSSSFLPIQLKRYFVWVLSVLCDDCDDTSPHAY